MDQLDPKGVSNVDKAKPNVMELAQEIVAVLMAQSRGLASINDDADPNTNPNVESAA